MNDPVPLAAFWALVIFLSLQAAMATLLLVKMRRRFGRMDRLYEENKRLRALVGCNNDACPVEAYVPQADAASPEFQAWLAERYPEAVRHHLEKRDG